MQTPTPFEGMSLPKVARITPGELRTTVVLPSVAVRAVPPVTAAPETGLRLPLSS